MAQSGPFNLTNFSSSGAGTAWSNPINAITSNNIYAVCNNLGVGAYSQIWKGLLLSDTGVIPDTDLVTGVKVEIERKLNGPYAIRDYQLFIVVGGAILGVVNHADTASNWPTVEAYKSYGIDGDTWGKTLTGADVKAADFGVYLVIKNNDGDFSGTAYIDHVRVTIWHLPPSPTSTFGQGAVPKFRTRRGFVGRNYGRGG